MYLNELIQRGKSNFPHVQVGTKRVFDFDLWAIPPQEQTVRACVFGYALLGLLEGGDELKLANIYTQSARKIFSSMGNEQFSDLWAKNDNYGYESALVMAESIEIPDESIAGMRSKFLQEMENE